MASKRPGRSESGGGDQLRLVEPGLVGGNSGAEGPGVEWARALLDGLQMRRVRDALAAEMAASVVAASWRPEAHDGLSDPAEVSAGQLERAAAEMIDAIAMVRFTVGHLVRMVAAGRTLDDIREDFPFIEPEDVQQALLYAAQATESEGLSLREPA